MRVACYLTQGSGLKLHADPDAPFYSKRQSNGLVAALGSLLSKSLEIGMLHVSQDLLLILFVLQAYTLRFCKTHERLGDPLLLLEAGQRYGSQFNLSFLFRVLEYLQDDTVPVLSMIASAHGLEAGLPVGVFAKIDLVVIPIVVPDAEGTIYLPCCR